MLRANSSVTTTPDANTLTYNKAAQELVTTGAANGGTLKYSLDNETWAETIPTGTDAGNYVVWYKVFGDANHNDTEADKVDVSIAKKPIEEATVALDGTTVLEGAFAWVDDTKEITANSTEKMKFTPTDTNYAEIEIDVAVDSYTTGGGGSSNTSTTTTKNEDGSTTKTTTNKATGTTTEVTTNTDGSTTTVETKKDGTVTTTEKDKDGNTTTTALNPDGSTTTEETKKDGTKVTAETNADGETTADVEAKGETEVVIPVPDADEVTKVVVTDKDGNETEVEFEVKDGGIAITVDGNASVSLSKGSKKEFVDVHPVDHWSEESVDYVYIRGLMKGTSENHFSPDATLTRAMLVTVLYRLEGEPEITNNESFADVENGSYYEKAVAWAKANGIINGVSKTEFAPNDNITREQIAAIMHRYAQYKGYDVSVGENTNILSYDDIDNISEYAIASMQYAVGSGLIKGKSESTLNPLDNATRAEAATILERFIEAN